MDNNLPIKLSKEPLLDAVFEMRFSQTVSASSILPGIFYNELEGEKTIEQLNISNVPKQIRDNDPNLRFAPIVKITWNKFLLLIGDNNVIIGCKMPYPGWVSLKPTILRIVDILNGVEAIQRIQRYSLKYVDLIPYTNLKDQIAAVNLNLQLAQHKLENEIFQLRIEIKKDGYVNSIQIVSSAVVTLSDQKTKKEGLVIDIDTICITDLKFTNFAVDLQAKLENIHSMNKLMFFSCLTPETLTDLGPIYE